MTTRGQGQYEEERCWQCGGTGRWGEQAEECDCCAGSGWLYTDAAIKLQIALEEEHRDD